jgi:hypothetical protein
VGERRLLAVCLSGLALAGAAAAPAAAASLEDALNARWRGGWVVVRAPVSSDCGGFYTDNEARGGRVRSGGSHDFAAGELARVERMGVKRGGRVDVFLDLAEQILEPRADGPFTLYEPRSCKVQLRVEDAGSDAASAERALAALLELHPDAPSAERSPSWSGRRREEYPEGYEETLAEHARWKAAQVNVAVQERLEEAIEEASRVNDRLRDDPEYLAGFAAGVERERNQSFGDCDSAVGARLYPDRERGKPQRWQDGYEDGQRLAYHLELMRRLVRCFVPVPPAG